MTYKKDGLVKKSIQLLMHNSAQYKLLSAKGVELHSSALSGTKPGKRQLYLQICKKKAKRDLDHAVDVNVLVEEKREEFIRIKQLIQDEIVLARQQYLTIRKSNDCFVTIYELLRRHKHLKVKSQMGYFEICKKHFGIYGCEYYTHILFIKYGDQVITCPTYETNLAFIYGSDFDQKFELENFDPLAVVEQPLIELSLRLQGVVDRAIEQYIVQ